MKKILSIAVLLVSLFAGVVDAQVYMRLAGDPNSGGYSITFARSHWIPSQQSILLYYGAGSTPTGDNGLRLFKPITNSWTTIYPNSNGASGPANRDNHNSLYVPNIDQLWVWGGTFPAGTYVTEGRFKVGACATAPPNNPGCLLAQSTTYGGAFTGVIKNFGGGTSDTGWEWSEACNCGLGFGGGNGGDDRYWIIEHNTAGSPSCKSDGTGGQPYVMCEIIGGTRPPARSQCATCLVAVGADFYLAGGSVAFAPPFQKDLWKFSTATRTWTQLADAPAVTYGYQSVATYDSDLNLVVVYGWNPNNNTPLILAYDITAAAWGDLSYIAAGQQCVFNGVGSYAPSIKKHVYVGGHKCPSGDSYGPATTGISLSGARLAGKLLLAPLSSPAPQKYSVK